MSQLLIGCIGISLSQSLIFLLALHSALMSVLQGEIRHWNYGSLYISFSSFGTEPELLVYSLAFPTEITDNTQYWLIIWQSEISGSCILMLQSVITCEAVFSFVLHFLTLVLLQNSKGHYVISFPERPFLTNKMSENGASLVNFKLVVWILCLMFRKFMIASSLWPGFVCGVTVDF